MTATIPAGVETARDLVGPGHRGGRGHAEP